MDVHHVMVPAKEAVKELVLVDVKGLQHQVDVHHVMVHAKETVKEAVLVVVALVVLDDVLEAALEVVKIIVR